MDNNLAFIKRKLDQEISDGTRKILQETSNPTPKTTMPSNQAESADYMSKQSGQNSVLEHIKLMKLPKYQIKGIVDRKNMDLQQGNRLRNNKMSSKTKEELFEEHLSQNKHFGSFNARDIFSGHPELEKSRNSRGGRFQTHESSPIGGATPYVRDYEDDQLPL